MDWDEWILLLCLMYMFYPLLSVISRDRDCSAPINHELMYEKKKERARHVHARIDMAKQTIPPSPSAP